VMAAPTIPVSAEENLSDPIDIRVDIIHPEPVAAVAFPVAAVVGTQDQHGEAIRGIHENLLGVPNYLSNYGIVKILSILFQLSTYSCKSLTKTL
ncbi:hypothetical protein Tco_1387979, partial [Tanacetum coccineum]